MQNFLKIIGILAVIGITIIATLFVLDIVTVAETKDVLMKVLLVLVILGLGGFTILFFTQPKS